MLIIIIELMILSAIITACSVNGVYNNDGSCKIDDDLEYLHATVLEPLKLGDFSSVIEPLPPVVKSSVDYDIPKINSVVGEEQKVGKQLNICPPNILIDVVDMDKSYIDNNKIEDIVDH